MYVGDHHRAGLHMCMQHDLHKKDLQLLQHEEPVSFRACK